MRKSSIVVSSLVVALAVVILGGLFARRAGVQAAATQTEVSGVISQQEDGQVVLQDDLTTYYLVSAIDLTPFLGSISVLDGALDDGTLYVSKLILGSISITDDRGTVTVDTVGSVQAVGDSFQITAEGILFTLYGNDLDQFVGQDVEVQGDLTGTGITVMDVNPV